MTSKRALPVVVLAAVLFAGTRPAAAAANKEHQQMMAELRMLQEQQAQVLQAIAGLNETLKLITTRIDDQAAVQRKAFADQKLILDNIAEAARILRERADDTNVSLSNVSQELQSLRQTVAAIPQNTTMPTATGETTGTGDPAGQTGGAVVPPNVSPGQFYQRVMGDYAAGQYDLAISGFEAFIRSFPTSPQADDAQLLIGNSWFNQGNFDQAVAAYQKLITDFPQSEQIPAALYKMGQSYENLKQLDEARKVYERVLKEFPASVEHSLARQRLDALNRRRG